LTIQAIGSLIVTFPYLRVAMKIDDANKDHNHLTVDVMRSIGLVHSDLSGNQIILHCILISLAICMINLLRQSCMCRLEHLEEKQKKLVS